ncbi:MAG TPA: HsdR family type I site-specific deoxyribonuclease [Solirubrobacteraceae bacterium]|jgi:type I restriction enzyme R subunit
MATERPEETVQRELVEGAVALGWTFVPRDEMSARRAAHMGEVIVEPLLVEALLKLNAGLDRDDAEYAAERIRRITDPGEFLEALRTGFNFARPGRQTDDIFLVDLAEPKNNSFVVTEEFVLRTGGTREPRLDTVFLVNGLPLMVVENKASTEHLRKAARDFADYWKDAPDLTVFAAIAGICNGSKFRVGATGAPGLSKYAEWKDTYPHQRPAGAGEMEIVLRGVVDPHTLVDLAANFLVFETREGVTTKKLARYQQYRAADKIVRRVKSGTLDRGIVWHTQGSGKSLTMVFTARKLLAAGLNNPTVFIVVDRTDLDEQINDTLTACEFDGVVRAESRGDLRRMLAADRRGVIVTTVHKFNEELSGIRNGDNVIVLVDEAHRSHEGDMGIWMRNALPEAKLFAFTGTPIETTDHSTRRAFSPQVTTDDGRLVHEDYLDAYRIKEAIDDGATVPIIYEPRLTEWALQREDVDEAFEHEFEGLTDEQREQLAEDAVRLATIAKKRERIAAIASDVAAYLRDHTAPQGFKAQLAAVDREACVLYAEELAKHLGADEFAVVMSRSKDVPAAFQDDPDRFRRWYAKPQAARLGEDVEDTDGDTDAEAVAGESETDALALAGAEKKAVKKLIKRFTRESDPLRLLIVNNMLLTGFDAPIEQVMFLDRGLSGHNLLQAIARTNRPYPKKDRGIVIDYWGVFSALEKALKTFNAGDVEAAAIKADELRERFPEAIMEALAVVAGFPADKSQSEQAAWLLARLERDSERAQKFDERFKIARSIYESLAPDPGLAPHLAEYRRLVTIHTQWRIALHDDDTFDPAEFRAKTAEIVQEAVDVQALRAESKRFQIDGDLLALIKQDELTAEEKAAQIEAALVHEIKVRGEHDPIARSLAERLRRLTDRKREADRVTLELLEQYEQLALGYQQDREQQAALGLSERAQAMLALAKEHLPGGDEDVLIEKARQMEARMGEIADFHGWQERDDVLAGLRRAFIGELATDPRTLDLATDGAFVDEAVRIVAAHAR